MVVAAPCSLHCGRARVGDSAVPSSDVMPLLLAGEDEGPSDRAKVEAGGGAYSILPAAALYYVAGLLTKKQPVRGRGDGGDVIRVRS